MGKKRTSKKRQPSKSARKKAQYKYQLLKILISLVLLAAFVVLAAVVARLFISNQPEPSKVEAGSNPPAHQPTRLPPVSVDPAPEKPTYEVFSAAPAPPPDMREKMSPAPGLKPPLVAIIVDDIGYERRITKQLLSLDIPLTFSFLPYAPFNKRILAQAKANGFEIMLHLPMEPDEFPKVNPGPGALLHDMTPDELIAQLLENLDSIPGIVGVNNHMGSRISGSSDQMRQIFSTLKTRDLFYIDSRTTALTVARSSAQLLQLPFAERDIFIDHFEDPQFIDSQLNDLIKRAKRQGYAIAIAHPHPTTVDRLKSFIPQLKEEVTLVHASTIVSSIMTAESDMIQTAHQTK